MISIILFNLILLIFIVKHHTSSQVCTNLLVTKDASADGLKMIKYAPDSHIRYGAFYFSPAVHWPLGSMNTNYDSSKAKTLRQIHQVSINFNNISK